MRTTPLLATQARARVGSRIGCVRTILAKASRQRRSPIDAKRIGSIVYNKLINPPHAITQFKTMGLDAGIAPNLPAGPTAEKHQARSASTRASTHGPQPADFPQARRGRGLASHRTPREQPVCFPGPDDTDHGVTTTAPGVADGRRDGGGDQPELAPRAQSLG